MALAFVPSLGTAIGAARPEETGVASGLVSTSHQIGSAVGLAVLTAVAAAFTGPALDATALTSGYSAAFAGAATLAFVGALVAAVTLRKAAAPSEAVEAELVA
jgi:sugar phosphate permease